MATKGAGHSMHSVWQEKCLHVPVTTFSTPGHLSCFFINSCGEQMVYCIPNTLHKMMKTDYPKHRNIYQKNWALCFMEFTQSPSQSVIQSISYVMQNQDKTTHTHKQTNKHTWKPYCTNNMLAGKACILCGWIPLLQSISVMSGGSAKWCHRSCRHTHWQLSEFTPSNSSVSSSLTNRLHNFGPMWTYLQQFNNAPLRLMWTHL